MTERPQFANEQEEAEWWDAHPEYIEELLANAQIQGTLSRGTVSRRLGLKSVLPASGLLSREDPELASAQAELRGLDVRAYVESLLHEALINAERQLS